MCKRCNGRGRGSNWIYRPEQQLAASRLGADKVRTHGLSFHPLYRRWQGMMARCYNANHQAFDNYGGRGITVCQSWHNVAAFINWIEANLGPRPDGCSMDRIDNDRGYEPGNLRWASPKTQNKNQRAARQPLGSAKSQAALTEEIVRAVRARYAAGEAQQDLAIEYGVSKPTMHKAIVGKTWKHVTDGALSGHDI